MSLLFYLFSSCITSLSAYVVSATHPALLTPAQARAAHGRVTRLAPRLVTFLRPVQPWVQAPKLVCSVLSGPGETQAGLPGHPDLWTLD